LQEAGDHLNPYLFSGNDGIGSELYVLRSTPVFAGKRIQDGVAGDRFAEYCPGRFAFGSGDGAARADIRENWRAKGVICGGKQRMADRLVSEGSDRAAF